MSPARAALQNDVVAACHVLDLDGQGSGLGGHVTAREPGARTFWCHGFGLAFDEVGADDLLHVDFGLHRLEGRWPVNPTLAFHAAIYAARPDVNAIVHTHADHVTALTASGQHVALVTQLASIFHDDLAALDEYDGVPTGASEGERIVAALGHNRALAMKNHGLVSVGATVGAAAIGALVLEACARVQLLALAGGPVSALPPAAAADAKRFLAAPQNTADRWAMLKRRAHRARPDFVPM
jgi:L-fuculose-phosphate aldolase